MTSSVNGASVRIIILISCAVVILCSRDTAIAAEGTGQGYLTTGDECEIGNDPEDWMPLEMSIFSQIGTGEWDHILANGDAPPEQYFALVSESETDPAWMDHLNERTAVALHVPRGEVSQAATLATDQAADNTATDDARLTRQFALFYGAVCLSVIVFGVGTELVRARRMRRQEIHEDKLERQLAALNAETSRQCEESAVLAQIQCQLDEHEHDMQRFAASGATASPVEVPAVSK